MPARRSSAVPDALGDFEQLVLFAVLRLEEASGIGIHGEIAERTGRDVSPGAIYTTLGRLEERGLVRAVALTTETGRVGRPRKHYRLEPAGARALKHSFGALQALSEGTASRLGRLAGRS